MTTRLQNTLANEGRMSTIYQATGLGRPIDLKVPSNLVAIAGTFVAGLFALWLSSLGSGQLDVFEAAAAAIGVFIAWALARELDPDRPGVAAVAMGIAGVLMLFGSPSLLAVGVLLLAVRLIAGTVGRELRTADYVLVVGAAAYAGTQPIAWPAALLLGYAVFASRAAVRRWAGPVVVSVSIGSALLTDAAAQPGLVSGASLTLLVLTTLAWLARRRVTSVQTTTDTGEGAVEPSRVSLARTAALLVILGGSFLVPDGSVAAMGPAIAAMVALAIVPQHHAWPKTDPTRETRIRAQ